MIAARRERTMPRWEESHTHSHDEFPRALACSSPTATPLLPGRRHELPNGGRSHRARVRTDPSCWRPVLNKWRLAAYFVRRVASAGPDGAPSPFLTMSALAPPCGPRRAAHVQLPTRCTNHRPICMINHTFNHTLTYGTISARFWEVMIPFLFNGTPRQLFLVYH